MNNHETPDREYESDGSSGAILIVDDRPDKLVTLQAALSELEHEIITASSGPEALRWGCCAAISRSCCSTSTCPAWVASKRRG